MVKIAAEASRKVGFRLKVKHGGMRIKRRRRSSSKLQRRRRQGTR